ncbi:MAG: DUF4071 domain-containing protein [Gemmatimonadetes bacterium]|nr:DUF4071 domain-containing protein [Gemmatimonadota bacterium]
MSNAPQLTEKDAPEELAKQVRESVVAGAGSLRALWFQWRSKETPPPAASLLVAKELIELASPEHALEVLADVEGVRADQLRAFACAKTGKVDEAIRLLESLRAAGHFDSETAGLLGGRYKQKWRKTGNPALLQAAYQAYRDSYDAEPNHYTGINAASLALTIEEPEESRRIAGEVLAAIEAIPGSEVDYWQAATKAQAQLLLGDLDAARREYRRVVAADWSAVQNIAIMRREARSDLANLGIAPDTLDEVLAVPRIAAFSGHRIDEADRAKPRFPEEKVGEVRLAIRERLHEHAVGFGFSSAAGGSDLLFLEELLERGGSARVFLPFPREDFARISVAPEWRRRFDRALDDPRVEVETLLDAVPAEPAAIEESFQRCNEAVYDAAVRFAKRLDEEAILLAVWDGEPGDGRGGTADCVKLWRGEGRSVETIAIGGDADSSGDSGDGGEGAREGAREDAREDTPRRNVRKKSAPAKAPRTPAKHGKRAMIVGGAIGAPTAPARGRSAYRARHCLCIGINDYTNWTPLQNGENDAREVANTLQERFAFEPHVIESERATRAGIYCAIAEELSPRVQEDDLFVLFFAGHGHTEHTPDGQKRGYVVPVDAPKGLSPNLIPMSDLSFWCGYLPCRHILYIFDSCFSGLLTLRSGADRRTRDMLKRKARVAITSGAADQEVLDISDTDHSAFTNQLLGALRGDLASERGDFTATELFSFLEERVANVAAQIGGYQTPTFGQLAGHESGDVLFQLPKEE